MSRLDELEARIAALEARKIEVDDLPLAPLTRRIENRLAPNADTFLAPGSVGADSLATTLIQGQICTSTTRPADPHVGLTIYETDTGNTRQWKGASWDAITP